VTLLARWAANYLGIGHATVVDDTGELQLLQVTERAKGRGFADRVTDKIRRVAEYGFSSVPPADTEVLVLRRGGDRAQPIVVGTSHRPSRKKNLQPGDVALYRDGGAFVLLAADRIEIDAAGHDVVVRNASKVRLETDLLEVTGDVVSRADGARVSLNAVRDAYHDHKHTGVQAGTATSGLSDHVSV
jgi:phage baseplate assembly protein V